MEVREMNVIPAIHGKSEWTEEVCEEYTETMLAFQTDPSIPEEGYRLEIAPDKVCIDSGTEAGRYYGMQTLNALLEEGNGVLCCGVIEDAPKYPYRGFMLDVSRHFFPVEEVKKLVNQCAKYKLNKFHWHLSDDQGFRIESRRFPELNRTGSRRVESDGTVTEGFYTQEEICEVVSYAAARQIEIIPEIDLSGHTSAIIASYPEFSCSKEPTEVKTKGGVYSQILCAGQEQTMQFLYELLDEIVPLFPGKFFHIGGDEAPKTAWKSCRHCQDLIRREHLRDEEELQAYFTGKLADYLKQKGKIVIGWNDILQSGERKGMIAQYWDEPVKGYSYAAVQNGQKFIFSNLDACYLDYPHCLVSLKGIYSLKPNIQGHMDIPDEQILGFEAPVWTEYIATEEKLEQQMFPRLLALAENAWGSGDDYEDFLRRAKAEEGNLAKAGIRYIPAEEAGTYGEAGIQHIQEWINDWLDRTLFGGVELPPEAIQENIASGAHLIQSCMQYAYTKEEIERVLQYLRNRESAET